MKKSNLVDATRVSFRLQSEVAAQLAERASQADTSHNLLARDMVIAAMLQPDEQRHEIEMLSQELGRIRSALAVANEQRLTEAESLSTELLRVRKALAVIAKQRHELEALRQEIAQARTALLERDEQWHNLLGTLMKEYSELHGSPPVAETNREALEMLLEEVAKICSELAQIRKLRGDFATGMNILLPNAGKLTPEQAKTWVQQTLLNR
jgi:hypothetical protein